MYIKQYLLMMLLIQTLQVEQVCKQYDEDLCI